MESGRFWPAFLSVGASILPFIISWSVRTAACCSEDVGARGVLSGFFVQLGLVLVFCSIAEFADGDHRKIWGFIVACLYSFFGAITLAPLYQLLYWGGTCPPPPLSRAIVLQVWQALGYFSVAVAGFLGGLFGVFWKKSWKQGVSLAALAGPSRLALLGGSISLVLMFPFLVIPGDGGRFGFLYSIPALIVLLSGRALYRGRWRPRVLGALIIAGSLAASLPFSVSVLELFYEGPNSYYYTYYCSFYSANSLWTYFALTGVVLAVMGGLQAIRRTKQPN